jgi:glycosyltransferase involved in cell wall biosynthesis
MKFIIEALGLTAGGGKQLARDLVNHLPPDAGHRFVLLLPEEAEHGAPAGGHLKLIICPKPRSLAARYHFLNHIVPALAQRERADALLCLGNFAPRSPVVPTAVLLHNAHFVCRNRTAEPSMTLRERLTRAYGRYALRRLHPKVHVIVQTPLMRDRVRRELPLHRSRISVIPNACDGAPDGPRRRISAGGPFRFLCLTEYYTHKNLEVLPKALAILPGLTSRRAQVVTTVAPGHHPAARRLVEAIERQGLEHQVVNLGPVSSEDLAAVYRACDALVLPTLLESFSRTYLEAMRFGLPILTSNRDFARSICGEAALYFDPLDAGSVARSMARVMTDPALRHRLAAEGSRRIREFPGWDELAGRFVEVLEWLARQPEAPAARGGRKKAIFAT